MATKNDKLGTALFFVNALHYEGAKRKDMIDTLVAELGITKANASYYVDRAAYKQAA